MLVVVIPYFHQLRHMAAVMVLHIQPMWEVAVLEVEHRRGTLQEDLEHRDKEIAGVVVFIQLLHMVAVVVGVPEQPGHREQVLLVEMAVPDFLQV